MPLIACPDCGAQVSDAAIVCPQCGFPLRRDALERAAAGAAGRPGGSSSTNKAGLIIALVVGGGLLMVFVLGIVAALVIPRFAGASERAKEKEGEGLLKQVYTLENAYFANNAVYAQSFEELKTVGWEEPVGLRYYTVELASTRPGALCIHTLPREGSGVRPIRIVEDGTIEPGVRCGETQATYGDPEAARQVR
ncbi:MAG: zinc-ribbon domain-containing protein [Longimicrobiaceae bacterium]